MDRDLVALFRDMGLENPEEAAEIATGESEGCIRQDWCVIRHVEAVDDDRERHEG